MAENESVEAENAVTVGSIGAMSESDLLAAVDTGAKGTATADDVRGAMVGTPRLERVKVVHAAGLFEMPGAEDGVKDFLGVIVAYTRRNAFFPKSIEEAGEDENRPSCFSDDGSNIGGNAEDPQADSCLVCPRNRAARDKAAREQAFDRPRKEACGNFLTLAVFVPGATVPYQVQFSQSAFKAWDSFIQGIGTRGQFLPAEVVTKFRLEKRSARGQTYSVPEFEFVGPLKAELAAGYRKSSGDYMGLLRRESVSTGGEGATSSAKEAAAKAREAADAVGSDEAGL